MTNSCMYQLFVWSDTGNPIVVETFISILDVKYWIKYHDYKHVKPECVDKFDDIDTFRDVSLALDSDAGIWAFDIFDPSDEIIPGTMGTYLWSV